MLPLSFPFSLSIANPSVIFSRFKQVVLDGSISSSEASQKIFVSGDPSPGPSLISWTHNGQPLTSSNDLGVIFLNGNRELLFPAFYFKQEGNYTATVSNAYGNSTDNFYLDVQGM